ncbi:MAG: hypothetical protein LKJ13_05185 [Clostridia bacterium]|nr:hypothetical protein [Clostridia bacterium]MCI1999679.1 hypothetical protein [Clostridia bacterium]MCI2013942.1 hypothetical protein [Clostridia bacterium]
MPYAEVSITKNFIEDNKMSVLLKSLTKILIESEGLKDNHISNSLALIDVKEFDNLYVGGEKSKQDKAVIKIYGFSDAFNEEIKKKLFNKITNAFISVSEKAQLQNGKNIWCIITPLGKSDFGVGGIPVTLELTKKIVSSHT